MSWDTAGMISQYLLKTGPIALSDLVTRMMNIPEALHGLLELEERREISIHGDRTALKRLVEVVDDAVRMYGNASDKIRDKFFTGLKQIPEADDIKIQLSESGFRKTSQAR